MPESIASLKEKMAKLQKSYDKKCLELEKARLNAQADRLRYDKRVFEMKQKVVKFETELEKVKHKTSISEEDIRVLISHIETLKGESDRP